MDKAEAEAEALRLWRAQPVKERMSLRQAIAFAKSIAPRLQFQSLGNHSRMVEGWIARDLMRTQRAVENFDEKQGLTPRTSPQRRTPVPIASVSDAAGASKSKV